MMYRVTYFNHMLDRRCVLIDNIEKETADLVLAKFGSPEYPFHYMGPETRIEEEPAIDT